MNEEVSVGCTRPELMKLPEERTIDDPKQNVKEEDQKMIKVGKPAPSFHAPAFFEGKFTNVNLEDYRGKWILLCFYPGDFTFV